jgi:hypothetical protein
VKANKIMEGQALSNPWRRKGKKVESNIDLATHNQTLKQLRQLNNRNHNILSILTLNVNRLNSPMKRHRLTTWIKKEDPTIYCLQETRFIDRNKLRLMVKSWKNIYHKTDRSGKTNLIQCRLQTYIDQMR